MPTAIASAGFPSAITAHLGAPYVGAREIARKMVQQYTCPKPEPLNPKLKLETLTKILLGVYDIRSTLKGSLL